MSRSRLFLPYISGSLAIAIWAASPAATAIAASEVPSELIGLARLATCATLLVPIAILFRPKLPSDGPGWAALIVGGTVGFAGSFFLQGLGIARTSTAHAALILALAPVFTAAIQFLLIRRWPKTAWWAGSTIALLGVALLIGSRDAAGIGRAPTLAGDLIVFAGTVTVSIGYVAGARLSSRIGLFAATCWSLLTGALVVLPLLPALMPGLGQATWIGWSSLGFLAVFCTLAGYALWFWALDRGGVTSIAPLQFGQPVASLVIAATLLSEGLSTALFLALGLIVLGVYLSRRAI